MEEYYENDNTGLVYRALDVSHYIDYRGRRFRQRLYTGFDVHDGEIPRWFVLTESDEAIARGLDIIQKFNELVRLSLITFKERRETNVWFDIFMDVRKYGWEGVFKMKNMVIL